MDNQAKTYYNVADVIIAIEGNNKYADALRKYFQNEEIGEQNHAEQLLIRVNESTDTFNFKPVYYSLSGKIAFNENEYSVVKNNYIYKVEDLFNKNKPTILSVYWTRKATLTHYLMNYIYASSIGVYSNADKFVDSIMNYEVFWYIFAMVLMKYNKAFVHSGIVSCEGTAIVIAGTGGCGKTSTLLQFLERSECKYIAEDFGIIGDDGYVYFTPKKAAIYQSDARYKNRNVLNALRRMTLVEKFFWNSFKIMRKNPRRRFSPYDFFGNNKINKSAKIREVIYMTRKESNSVKKLEIDEERIAEKISCASFRELRELYEILYNIRAVGNEKIREAYPPLERIQSDYCMILLKAVKNAKTGLIEVPLKISPCEIVNTIVEDY